MYLSQIRISGFKSFLENTNILLVKNQITVIVGPNGCGKSNVFDAVRWAIGEGGSKLRVAINDNVIFSGSENSAAVNLSQVHLHFINDDQIDIARYGKMHEFQISRKFFRNGNNQYYINQSPCRLLDVKTLLMELGVSYSGYSFIEQGNVTQIIQSKPEEKRQIIEEAAGLMKFKTLKKDSENKLNNAENNLNRIADRVLEFRVQYDKLSKQAELVDDYLKIKGRIEFLRKMSLATQWQNINQKLKIAIKENSKHSISLNEDKLIKTENDLVSLENKLLLKEQTYTKLQHNYQTITQELQKITSKWQVDNQLFTNTNSWIAKSEEEKYFLQQKIKEKKQELSNIKNKKLPKFIDNSKLQESQKQVAILEQQYQDFLYNKEQLSNKEQKISLKLTAQQSLVNFQSQKIQTPTTTTDLKNLRQEVVNQWLEQKTSKKKYLLQQSASIESESSLLELETTYQELQETQKIIQKKYNQLQNCITQTKQALTYQSHSLELASPLKNFDALKNNGFIGFFSQLFSIRKEAPRSAFHFFDNFLHIAVFASKNNLQAITKSLEQISVSSLDLLFLDELTEDFAPNNSLAKEIIFTTDLTLGQEKKLHCFFALLENTTELPQKTNKIFYSKEISSVFPYLLKYQQVSQATLSEQYTQRRIKLQQLEKTLSAAKIDLSTIELTKERTATQLIDCKNQILHHRAKKTQQTQKTSVLQDNYWKIQITCNQKKKELQQIRNIQKERAIVERDLNKAQKIITQLTVNKKQILAETAIIYQKQDSLQVKLNQKRAKQQAQEKELDSYALQENFIKETALRIQNELDYSQDLLHKKQQQITDWQQTTQNITELAKLQQNILVKKKYKAEQLELLENTKKALLQFQVTKKELQQKQEILRQTISENKKNYYESELNISMLSERQKNFAEQLHDNYTTTAAEVLRYFQSEEFQIKTAKEELQQLQKKMPLFVNINLGAKEEYAKLKQKLEFYTQQKQDLDQSLFALRESISTIEQNSKDSFYRTFKQIDQAFQRLFAIVFGGGSAALILDNKTDLLNTGVEIFVQPLGKKMQNLTLLSSGEKSLVGLVFVFAVLQVNPSIFCFLDEVDAALDTVNVERIIAIIKEIAKSNQIIMITHNQKTILVGDVVLGVTMLNEGISRIFSVDLTEQKNKCL